MTLDPGCRLNHAVSRDQSARDPATSKTVAWAAVDSHDRRLSRLGVFWPDERVVELDGPVHRERHRFADDRRRDVQLQQLGHDVLRFTNEQVLADVAAVVEKIGQLLRQRRDGSTPIEMRQHVDH